MNSPYEPPKSRTADPAREGRRPSWIAVLIGLVVDVVGTHVFLFLTGIAIGIVSLAQGRDQEGLMQALTSLPVQLFALAGGSAFTLIGGYVSARVANHLEYRHGLYLGLASVITSELLLIAGDAPMPVWQHIAFVALAVPAGIYGGHVRAKEKRSGA
jgi:hypothetical protein